MNISQKIRKKVALLLLLNIVSYTVLLAFPQRECNGVCSIKKSDKCECSIERSMSCCDMMETNSHHNTFSYKSEITHNSCSYELLIHEHNNYIIPKINDSKVDLNTITEIHFESEVSSVQNFFISHKIISNVGPPIYLNVSSFLI